MRCFVSEGSSLGPADFQEMGRRALEELVAALPLSPRDGAEAGAETLRRELVTRVLSSSIERS